MMVDRVRVFDRYGIQIDELRASVERSYGLMVQCSAKFKVSAYDSKCIPAVLNFGNWVLIENSDGLPDWVGMIDDRDQARDGVIVTAYSPEIVFRYRRGPRALTLKGSPGSVFAQMIYYINGLQETVLQEGNIESRGELEETLNPVTMDDDLRRIVERSGQGYRWRPEVNLGELTVYGDWYSDLTMDTGLILHDGYNISSSTPIRENPPVNDVLIYGNGSTWANRILAEVVDVDSVDLYGLRQYSENVQTPSQETLNTAATNKLVAMKNPTPIFSLDVANVGNTFAQIAPGVRAAVVRIASAFGFSAVDQVTVLAMTYNPENGFVTPTLRYEVKND